MTKIKLGTILEDAALLAGRDATYNPLPAGWKVLAAMSLNVGIRHDQGSGRRNDLRGRFMHGRSVHRRRVQSTVIQH